MEASKPPGRADPHNGDEMRRRYGLQRLCGRERFSHPRAMRNQGPWTFRAWRIHIVPGMTAVMLSASLTTDPTGLLYSLGYLVAITQVVREVAFSRNQFLRINNSLLESDRHDGSAKPRQRCSIGKVRVLMVVHVTRMPSFSSLHAADCLFEYM